MAKDPNYNRYAGMRSLPGPDGKMPRQFRVDEDGAVIYLDAPKEDEIVATAAQGAVEKNGKISGAVRTRKTIGEVDYDVINANTYDPALSNGKTAIPNADVISVMNANMRQTAVRDAGPERGAHVIRLPVDFSGQADDGPASERNLPLTNPKREMYYSLPSFSAKPGTTPTANTLNFGRELPVGTVALGHGHPDDDSDGMIDDWNPLPKSAPVIGDVGSLLRPDPMPMATVSRGRIGWHQLEDGRLQFMYPSGALTNREVDAIQMRLNQQQSLFHRRGQ